MNKNLMNIDRYIKGAESNFSNLIGNELDLNFYGGPGSMDTPSMNPSAVQPYGGSPYYGMYANARGASMYSRVDGGQPTYAPNVAIPAKQPTPYQVNVTNTTAGTLTVVLFGLNSYLLTANFGSSTGVTVTPAQANVSYLELLQQSASQPFETSLVRIQTSNSAQLTQILTLTSKDANGQSCTIPIITQSYFSANQFQSTILDVPYPVKIDGNTYLTFPILASTTATYTFFPAEKVNPARNLNGQDQQQVYANPVVPVAVPMFAPAPLGVGQMVHVDPSNR
jgi:hypothetical protein